jgi:hypothetical protein
VVLPDNVRCTCVCLEGLWWSRDTGIGHKREAAPVENKEKNKLILVTSRRNCIGVCKIVKVSLEIVKALIGI